MDESPTMRMLRELSDEPQGPVEVGAVWSGRLAEWLERLEQYDPDRDGEPTFQTWSFPTDDLLQEFLTDIHSRSEQQMRHVLRCLMWEPGTFVQDHDALWWRLHALNSADEGSRDDAVARLRSFLTSEYGRRLVRRVPAQPGVRWVIDLVARRPRLALAVIDAYLSEFAIHLPDGRFEGLTEARAIISARYMRPRSVEMGLDALRDVTPRDLEVLAHSLYTEMGYACELTKQSRDGGRDVIARRGAAGRREHRLIECKHYGGTVGVEPIRALAGVVSLEHATSGVIVTTSRFSPDARELAERTKQIELIDGSALVGLLTEHFGGDWFTNLDHILSRSLRTTTATL